MCVVVVVVILCIVCGCVGVQFCVYWLGCLYCGCAVSCCWLFVRFVLLVG